MEFSFSKACWYLQVVNVWSSGTEVFSRTNAKTETMRLILLLGLFLLISTWGLADEVKPAADETAVTRQEVETWREQAERGMAPAQYWLGKAYVYGWHVERDPETGFSLFQKSAEAGFPRGMNALGYCFQLGLGTEQDHQAALEWLQRATEAGDPEATNNLGNSYYLGWGVEVDEARALELYRQAADAGSAKGMYNVAKCYRLGAGVEKDTAEALVWFEKAAAGDDLEALLFLGWEYTFGSKTGELKERGLKYYTRAADMGSTEAMVSLGKAMVRSEKPGTASRWFRKAASLGNPDGQFYYGGALLYGEGVKQDRTAGIEWLEKAAAQGNQNARELLNAENVNQN